MRYIKKNKTFNDSSKGFIFNNIIQNILNKNELNKTNIKNTYNNLINKKNIVNECNICFDNNDDIILFCCFNKICSDCKKKMINKNCPFCRTNNYMYS